MSELSYLALFLMDTFQFGSDSCMECTSFLARPQPSYPKIVTVTAQERDDFFHYIQQTPDRATALCFVVLEEPASESVGPDLADYAFLSIWNAPHASIWLSPLADPQRFDAAALGHVRRCLPFVAQNIARLEQPPPPDGPRVLIGVMCYNQQEYIDECLDSLLCQQGHFQLEILVLDDASKDGTYARALERSRQPLPAHIQLTVLQNKNNRGYWIGYRTLFDYMHEHGHDFIGFLDGDDCYTTSARIQTHLDFLGTHPGCALSFSRLLLYEEGTENYTVYSYQNLLDKTVYTAQDLAVENFISNSGCSLIRANATHNYPPGFFTDIKPGDWFVHLLAAESGNIGYINKIMTLYRRNEKGVWARVSNRKLFPCLLDQMNKLHRVTDCRYYAAMFTMRENLMYAIRPRRSIDLLVVDDVFPHPASGFRMAEFSHLLQQFPNMRIYITSMSTHVLGRRKLPELAETFLRDHPQHIAQLVPYVKYSRHLIFENARLAYFCFLSNVFVNITRMEHLLIPFVFELYPGGAFVPGDCASDAMLRRVIGSPCFRKVIVTQDITKNYLLDGGFCKDDDIVEVFGVVIPEKNLARGRGAPRLPRAENEPFNVCFAAMRYTETGRDKGYDVFVETAKQLHSGYPDMHFHVAGNFTPDTLDVRELGDSITFHGRLPNEQFAALLSSMHVFLSPNAPDVLRKGHFDGFPTGACTDAGLCGALMVCTDPLGLNGGRFVNHEEIEIIPHDAAAAAAVLTRYYKDPRRLADVVAAGRKKLDALYSSEAQMKPRVRVLEEEIAHWRENRTAISHAMRPFLRSGQPKGQLYGTLFYRSHGEQFHVNRSLPFSYYLAWDNSFCIIIYPPVEYIPHGTVWFRVDLCEYRFLDVYAFGASLNGEALQVEACSGVRVGERMLLPSHDPQIFLSEHAVQPTQNVIHLEGKLFVCQPCDEGALVEQTQDARAGNVYFAQPGHAFVAQNRIAFGYCAKSGAAFSADIPLAGMPAGSLALRLDVLEDEYCACRLTRVTLDGRDISVLASNGRAHRGRHVFATTDPFFFLGTCTLGENSVLRLEGELETGPLATLEAKYGSGHAPVKNQLLAVGRRVRRWLKR